MTDSGPTSEHQAKPDVIKNIFSLMELVSSPETLAFFEEKYNTIQIRYGDMKKQLAEDMILFTAPFREKINALAGDEAEIHKIASKGAEKARESASATLKEARPTPT